MSNIDKRALREVAEKATPGNWHRASSRFNGITVTPFSLCDEEVMLAHAVEKRDAEFIAAANPATMLALLDENLQLQREKDAIEAVALALRDDMRQAREQLEAAEKRNAELERSETQLIDERDNAESALNDAYKAVMGQAPEWSNWFSFENAIDEIELACEQWRNQTDDVIRFRQRIAELEKGHQEAAKQINSWRRLAKQNIAERGKDISELEAARQRIAELERTEIREDGNQFLVVRHPGKLPVIKHCVGELEDFLRQLIERDSLVTIDIITHRYYGVGGQWVQDADEYLQMMQGDGIGVKQQEDSVDSDVGRNQPGMVVAVHANAGDFVKVKGQVFEVEETDFDDHDVTLWFVGGNALKCAAGCPVEVVSAPVAAGIKVKGE
ncbi:ead/Ea22-like family protein [Salmonella enterica]|uniref:ead/Ea22-like family protein n=2 Tax=Salmonella enterica TaxID=28901 RepID=UPI00098E7A09